MKLELSRQVIEKFFKRQNVSSRSRDVPCVRTDMMKLIVFFAILRTRLKKDSLFENI